jgi:hypothetical protein
MGDLNIYMIGTILHKLSEKGDLDWVVDTEDPNWYLLVQKYEERFKKPKEAEHGT